MCPISVRPGGVSREARRRGEIHTADVLDASFGAAVD